MLNYFLNSLYSRYRAENTIICGMTPGPKEPTAEQLQNYLKPIVDDLIQLYDHGITVKGPGHSNGEVSLFQLTSYPFHSIGIRVRVALVAIIADHPALCKLCGFADHSHNNAPCTKCCVSRENIFTDKSLRNGMSYVV
jgi:hypothetical protein